VAVVDGADACVVVWLRVFAVCVVLLMCAGCCCGVCGFVCAVGRGDDACVVAVAVVVCCC